MLTCPKCNGTMQSYNRSGVQIEQCSGCKGIFLDYGELEALAKLEAQFSQQQQPQQQMPPPPPMGGAPAWGTPSPYGGGYGGGGGYHGHYKHHKHFGRMLFST